MPMGTESPKGTPKIPLVWVGSSLFFVHGPPRVLLRLCSVCVKGCAQEKARGSITFFGYAHVKHTDLVCSEIVYAIVENVIAS